MSNTEIIYIVLLVICLILSAFFSSSETAFISLQRVRLEHLIETRTRGAKLVAKMIEHPERLLSTVLLGNNFVNTAATALATVLAISFWGEKGVLISTIVLTVVLLVFAETTPKTIAAHHSERVSLIYARPLRIISWFLSPIVTVLSWIASIFAKLFGEPPPRALVSDDEIRTMISIGHKEGTVEKSEAEMLTKVFDFGDRPVREVMIPRLEIIAIEQGSKISEFLSLYSKSPLSRFPVYKESLDNITGILSIKDVLMGLAKGSIAGDSSIDELIRPAYFTPETKRVSELFIEMRDKNYHMAVVVDEYGGTAGVVSLNGLVEEIVGPVGDEMGAAEKEYEAINEYTFQIDGSMRVEEVNEEMGLNLPEGDYETVAGFILHLLGRIPKQGEQLRYKDIKIVITKMRGLKIEEILLTKEKSGKTTDATATR